MVHPTAYALAGRVDLDLTSEPLGNDRNGRPVFLKEIWPSPAEVQAAIRQFVKPDMYRQVYAEVFTGDEHWRKLTVPSGDRFAWDAISTYVQNPPYFVDMPKAPAPVPGSTMSPGTRTRA